MLLLHHTHKATPIAIYDSGVGGLGLTKALKALLPQECIHYIGDTKNLPYGEKTTTELCGYIKKVVHFCLHKRYKLLVIACHTATTAATHFLPSYLETLDQRIGIINVIDPIVTHITTANIYNHISLIGTKYTVASGIYAERLQTTGITLSSLTTPLLVPMVEAYFCDGQIDSVLLNKYLSQLPCQTIDALIPACTHYIFLEKELKRFFEDHYQKEIEIIDTARLTALAVKQLLISYDLSNNAGQTLPDCFMATALTPAFQNASQQLFGQTPIKIDLEAYSYSPLRSSKMQTNDLPL